MPHSCVKLRFDHWSFIVHRLLVVVVVVVVSHISSFLVSPTERATNFALARVMFFLCPPPKRSRTCWSSTVPSVITVR